MKESMLLRKICSIYANDLHFATIIFPFINKELEKDTIIKTILENDEQKNIEKILENIGLNSQKKEEIRKVDWKSANIGKIRKNFKLLEEDIKSKKKIDLIIAGSNIFIEKINKAIDLWIKNKIDIVDKEKININIINCFSFEKNNEIDKILNGHDYILKTAGIEEIIAEEELLKAN